ncbi:IS66 family insertion sequence element accessory protein TnpB [Desulfogranum marinum]|uniref:IS66 family insertion sequence element accessory protein TnpB n=1 Tax=Desulfogranum marinum TaxID=453220 RepID=UPI0029C8877D|nr:IS66 family insertion sequence element accessory protein TnpB [Desulfogranum marinum]
MIYKPSDTKVYIALGATDMWKSINGLSLLVEEQFGLDLFSGSFFAFCNRKRDIVKILYWADNGFCIWLKRLEEEVMEVNQVALEWLLHGLDMDHAHQRLPYNSTG